MAQLTRKVDLTPEVRESNRKANLAELARRRAASRARLAPPPPVTRSGVPGSRHDVFLAALAARDKPKLSPTTVKAKRKRKKKKANFRQEQLERRESSREDVVNRRVAALEARGRTEGGVVDSAAFSKLEPERKRATRSEVDNMFRQALAEERARNARLRGEDR